MWRSPVSVIVNRWVWPRVPVLPAARDLVTSGNESAAANTGFAHETHFGLTYGVLESRERR
jgi:hypothetical protein